MYSMSIPVVNVSGVLSGVIEKSPVLQQLHNAFTTVGFVFITGHGIPREMVRVYFKLTCTMCSFDPIVVQLSMINFTL